MVDEIKQKQPTIEVQKVCPPLWVDGSPEKEHKNNVKRKYDELSYDEDLEISLAGINRVACAAASPPKAKTIFNRQAQTAARTGTSSVILKYRNPN